ncbi:NTP transferase domain-containing protein [Providencia rettgeri]
MNAIILAAGLGSRFGDITKKTHKSLLPINNQPNIERTIKYLIEFGIKDIYIVVGYLSESFQYLKEKYNCHLIYNENYDRYNNFHSFYKAFEYFENSFVIDADVVLLKNIFEEHSNSVYYIINRLSQEKEWIPILNDDGFVNEIIVSSIKEPSLLGISFWTKNDCEIIKDKVSELLEKMKKNNSEKAKSLIENGYWDDIPKLIISKLKVKTKLIDYYDAGEMDNLENYLTIQNLCSEQLKKHVK